MIKIVVTILILVSSIAAISFAVKTLMQPETALVYINAKMSHINIQLLSLLLALGAVLILLPQTFKFGGALLIIHSTTTVVCYFLAKDWKGGALEFVLLQIPIFMIYIGYPSSVLEWARDRLS